jgi:hypothetical protein
MRGGGRALQSAVRVSIDPARAVLAGGGGGFLGRRVLVRLGREVFISVADDSAMGARALFFAGSLAWLLVRGLLSAARSL